jgi:hypothetical protein
MGVHKLTTSDLENLGRWKSKSKDPNHCPEYMVRKARNDRKKRPKLMAEAPLEAHEMVRISTIFGGKKIGVCLENQCFDQLQLFNVQTLKIFKFKSRVHTYG